MCSDWNAEVYRSRIADGEQLQRFEACSPNAREIEQYRDYALSALSGRSGVRALVLGMTPELRCMAVESGFELVSADVNPDAIALFRDWLPEPARKHEAIMQVDWMALGAQLTEAVDVVLGDGVFGNVLSLEGHQRLLRVLAGLLKPGGAIILRQALIPRHFSPEDYEVRVLLDKYRNGELCDADFGMAMRLWGVFRKAYNPDTCLLDNAIVYGYLDELQQAGDITAAELAVTRRYYFSGKNMLLQRHVWEEIVTSSGLNFEVQPLAGKNWYSYYPVYCCRLAA